MKLVAAWRATGSYAAKPEGGWRYSKLDPHRAWLERRVEEKADITMPELAEELAAKGVLVAPASVSGWYRRNGYRYKKTLLASEQDRADVRAARREWVAKRQPRMRREAHRLVFVDETGTTKMTRLRGRCLKGCRLNAKAPLGTGKSRPSSPVCDGVA